MANLASPQVNAGPFARAFPAADFYAVDQQYSFPLPLPAVFLGLPSWTKPLPRSSEGLDATWLGGEFEHAVLTVKPGPGSYFQDAAPPTPPPSLASQQRTFRDVSSLGRRALPQAVQDAPALRRGALGDGGAASHPDERPRVRACAALPRARRQMPNTTCKPESALTRRLSHSRERRHSTRQHLHVARSHAPVPRARSYMNGHGEIAEMPSSETKPVAGVRIRISVEPS